MQLEACNVPFHFWVVVITKKAPCGAYINCEWKTHYRKPFAACTNAANLSVVRFYPIVKMLVSESVLELALQ